MTEYNEPVADEMLLAMNVAEFTRLVNASFKSYDSLLELARSPLAHSSLVAPALILDSLQPTADERGRALRIVLRWAVSCLAPTPPTYPLGVDRPFDDPSWLDPLWWGYNLLRHRYLEPLHPDNREGGFTDALLALTGIPDADRLFDVRKQAILDIARLLQEHLRRHWGDSAIQRLALEGLYQELQANLPLLALLGLASTFRGVFPREALLDLAITEDIQIHAALSRALQARYLQAGDAGATLWMSPVVQAYLHANQPQPTLRQRHRRAAHYYRAQIAPLQTAWHLRLAGDFATAATTLLDAAPALMGELQTEELRAELLPFTARQLPAPLWFQVQQLLADVHFKLRERDAALAVCHIALKAADGPAQQAQIYRRMGKLYEKYNEQQALDYYERAIGRFPASAPELIDALKDRAWIYIQRQEWARAEADLVLALQSAPSGAWRQRSDIHTALASLYRQQHNYEDALYHARQAHTLREEYGDAQLAAEAKSNVALVYAEMGETPSALATYKEALDTFAALRNRVAVATVLLNMGMTLQLANQLPEAVNYYQQSLALFEEYGVPLDCSRLCYNLTETYVALGNIEKARAYWEKGRQLSQDAGLESELIWYEKLLAENPPLQAAPLPAQGEVSEVIAVPYDLSSEEKLALTLAREEGQITPKRLMTAARVSKPTATRKLARLVELGLLSKQGHGRETHYIPANIG